MKLVPGWTAKSLSALSWAGISAHESWYSFLVTTHTSSSMLSLASLSSSHHSTYHPAYFCVFASVLKTQWGRILCLPCFSLYSIT